MNTPKQTHSLCPACDACPAVEIYDDGRVTIGEAPNLATLGREEWNRLVRAVKSGTLDEIRG
ncbi:MAG: hypothetical protein ACREMN_13930 [Gemmatimonadales bacterium]